jgi:hypothetical protein
MKRPSLPFVPIAAAAALLLISAVPAAAQTTVRLPAADRAVQGRSTPVFVLRAGAEGAPADPADAAFGADGSLYVLDRGTGRVRVYGLNGQPLRQIGQPGRGPGRLASPAALALTADGRVVVSDPGQQGLAVFGVDGTFQRFVSLAADGGLGGHGELEALPGGGVLVALNAGGGGHGHGGGVALARHSLEANARAVRLVTVPEEVEAVEAESAPGRTRMQTRIRPLFAPRMSWGVLLGGGAAVAGSVEYRVRTFGPTGAPASVLLRPIPSRAPTDADQEAGRAAIRSAFGGGTRMETQGGGEVRASGMEAMFANTPFGNVPAVQRITVDPRGRMWIERAGPVWGRPGPVDVVGADGAYLGTIAEPLPVAWGPNGLAASLERDAEGRTTTVSVRRLPASLR